jgi:DNA-binding GntR family transcriptional regulator
VTVVKNVGVRVRTLDAREIDEIHALRLVLEREIGAGAAANATPGAISVLESVFAAMSAAAVARDTVAYAAANFRFHDELARASGNRRLHDVYARLVAELSLARRRSHARAPGSLDVSLSEHREVLDAIIRGDARVASERLVAHARNGRSRLGDALGIDPIAAPAAAHSSER